MMKHGDIHRDRLQNYRALLLAMNHWLVTSISICLYEGKKHWKLKFDILSKQATMNLMDVLYYYGTWKPFWSSQQLKMSSLAVGPSIWDYYFEISASMKQWHIIQILIILKLKLKGFLHNNLSKGCGFKACCRKWFHQYWSVIALTANVIDTTTKRCPLWQL